VRKRVRHVVDDVIDSADTRDLIAQGLTTWAR
jgi:hypothetical protein